MTRVAQTFIAGLTGALLLFTAVPAAPVQAASLTATTVQSGLTHAWDIAFTPDGRMLVTERPGRLRVYASGSVGARALANFTIPSVHAEGEGGLMGIAVDRNFASNQRIYMCATRNTSLGVLNQVLRYRLVSSTQLTFDGYLMRTTLRASTIHNGCAVEHLADGMIWVAMGDANDPGLAQNPNSYNGKILRVTVDGAIPSSNPIMPGASGRTAVYSMGHRNPQGIAQQPGTGYVFAIEHGPSRDDEINRIVAGGNYGWPCYTGAGVPHNNLGGSCRAASNYRNPSWASGSPTWATSNMTFLAGSSWGAYANDLLATTLKEQDIRRYDASGATITYVQTHWNGTFGRVRGIVQRGAYVYVATSNGSNDRVIQMGYRP